MQHCFYENNAKDFLKLPQMKDDLGRIIFGVEYVVS